MTDPVWLFGRKPHYRPFAVVSGREQADRLQGDAVFSMAWTDAWDLYRSGVYYGPTTQDEADTANARQFWERNTINETPKPEGKERMNMSANMHGVTSMMAETAAGTSTSWLKIADDSGNSFTIFMLKQTATVIAAVFNATQPAAPTKPAAPADGVEF